MGADVFDNLRRKVGKNRKELALREHGTLASEIVPMGTLHTLYEMNVIANKSITLRSLALSRTHK